MRTRFGSPFGLAAALLAAACGADTPHEPDSPDTTVSPSNTTPTGSATLQPTATVATTSAATVSGVNPSTAPAGGTGASNTGGVAPNTGATGSTGTVGSNSGDNTSPTTSVPSGTASAESNIDSTNPVNPDPVDPDPVNPEPILRPSLVTSAQGAYWTVGEVTQAAGAAPDLTVDVGTAYQQWLGFGGSFNEQGWDALSDVSPEDKTRAIKLLFDKAEGAALEFGRIPIGASDYAVERYTLNDTPDDFEMANFSIDHDKALLIPYIKAALAVNPNIRLWASPWTPPAWMKSNGKIDGTSKRVDGSTVDALADAQMKGDAPILGAFALYLARFVEEYAKEDISIESVMPQNEPGYATRYPSCLWSTDVMRTFVGDHLGPLFAERGIDAEIWFGTMSNDQAGKDGDMLTAIAADAKAMTYVKGFGLQWNMISFVDDLVSKNLPIVQTEHKCGNYPFTVAGAPPFNAEQPPNDHAYGEESWGLIRDWLKAGVNSYSAWNMVLDVQGKNLDFDRPWPQNALLVVDRAAGTFTATAAYYVFRHLSYFVEPGAKRIATGGSGDALAFQNPDGAVVTVVYNNGNQAKATTLGIGDTRLQFEVPAHGWATVNWK
jgi:glucosylceramidase